MSSGGKGGSNTTSKQIYGTLVGALGWGPWDWIKAVIHNGNYLFQGDLALTTDVTDLTGAIADPSYLAPGGSLKIYRGTETQPADVTGRRNKGTVTIEGIHLFFGQDTGTAPNLLVIGGGIPRVPTAIVAADDNVADDGQVNPIAAWAEVLLDERGGGFDQAVLDAPSWLAAGHWAYLNRAYCFISPLVNEQTPMRDLAKQFLDPMHGFCRWTKEGKLACQVYEWGVDPGGLITLDARHFKRRPKIPLGDWDSVKTELIVSFTNRDFDFQNDTIAVPNARAAQIRNCDDQGQLDRRHVTRATQAHAHGTEFNRRLGTAPSQATLKLRRPFLEEFDLEIGAKVKIDTDPEPGGAGLAQLCRIERIRQDRSDEAELVVVTDNLVPATAYTPTIAPPSPAADDSPPLQYFLGVPLPPNAFGWPASVALLATRPVAKIVGFQAFFGPTAEGSYADLGRQGGFAVRATLHADAAADALTLPLVETDGLNAPDASLAASTPGGNATEAGDNVLLALLATLDGNGRIALAASGDPVMEFVSIVDRATAGGLPAGGHNYTVLRGRLGTTARAWTAAGTVVWIVPRANLVPWRHTMLSAMFGGVAYFRLVSYTQGGVDDTIPVPQCSVNMLPATAPMYGGVLDGDTTPEDAPAPDPISAVTVSSHIEALVLQWSNPTNVPLLRIDIYESDTAVMPASATFGLPPKSVQFFRTGLAEGATRYYWFVAVSIAGRRSVATGPHSATVVTWPTVTSLNGKIDGVARTLVQTLASVNEAVAALIKEEQDRIAAINSEASTRATADAAEVTARETAVAALTAALAGKASTAALSDAITLLATRDEALANTLVQLFASLGEYSGAIVREEQVRADAVSAEAATRTSQIANLQTQVDARATIAALTTETNTRVSQVEAMAKTLVQLFAALGEYAAGITREESVRATETGSLAAEYALQVITTGSGQRRVAGFRITNLGGAGGATDFLIQADKVAIVNTTGENLKAPFAVDGGVVYMNMAMIKTASITSAMIENLAANKIVASSLSAITATIGLLRTATSGARTEIEDNQIRVYDSANTLRVKMGVW